MGVAVVEIILGLLETALSIWDNAAKTTYINQVTALRQQYYTEFNLPDAQRDDAVLDNIVFQLNNLAAGFMAEVNASQVVKK